MQNGNEVWIPAAEVVLRHIAGEHMLIPTVTREVDLDNLFMLNQTGVFVWEQMDGLKTTLQICNGLAGKFGISNEQAQQDVYQFLMTLDANGLAKRGDG